MYSARKLVTQISPQLLTGFVHCVPRRKYVQYFVVPNDTLKRENMNRTSHTCTSNRKLNIARPLPPQTLDFFE